jgi:polyhydroxyalkanoate synthesis repressor PhaR
MGELRTVRKYSNRRLYDHAEGRYVTLAELCERVVDGDELRVIDADTKEDITCSVLFQMMAAQEKRVDPSMSRGFLLQAIRSRAETPCRVPRIVTVTSCDLDQFAARLRISESNRLNRTTKVGRATWYILD